MKRKLLQTELSDLEQPIKVYHTSPSIANSFCNSTSSPSPGNPIMASTPPPPVFQGQTGYRVSSAVRARASHVQPIDAETEAELQRVVENFVTIYEKLDKCEGVDVKPNYSYTELAYLAMLRSPNFCLPITEIYKYIQSRFLFFKNSTRKHWKNAVRHSLAKTMCFTKIPIGRGTSNSENLSRSTYLWCIVPNSITCFARGDYRPSVDKESGTNTLRLGFYRVNASRFWNQVGSYVSDKMVTFKHHLQQSPEAGRIFERQTCRLPNVGIHVTQTTRQPLQMNTQYNRQTHVPNQQPMAAMPVYNKNNNNNVVYQFQNSPTSHLRHELEQTPPHVRMPISQSQNAPIYQTGYFTKPESPLPNIDPWLPKIAITSPDTSMCSVASMESERRTPPYSPFECRDSGNETCESSPDVGINSSCRLQSSCRQQPYGENFASPNLGSPFDEQFPVEHGLDHLDLSPLSGSDFAYLCTDLQQSYDTSCELMTSPNISNYSEMNMFASPCAQMPNCSSPELPAISGYNNYKYQMESPTLNRCLPAYSNTNSYGHMTQSKPLYMMPDSQAWLS